MPAVTVEQVSKTFGRVHAVTDLSFAVEFGSVTGFLGPNGAGKTTTLRMVLGLVRPDAGSVAVAGRRYVDLEQPLRSVGAVLEASSFHPGRTARNHLRVLCSAGGLPRDRVQEVLGQVGLLEAADRRVGGFSLGMRQRLGLAAALLGDPRVLVLDEPANGLDPAGMHWLRGFLRFLADQGRAVLVSSHVLAEVEQIADAIVIIAAGRLVRSGSLTDVLGVRGAVVRVRTEHTRPLADALVARGAKVAYEEGALLVTGVAAEDVGRAALDVKAVLSELRVEGSDLERVFLALTGAPPQTGPVQLGRSL